MLDRLIVAFIGLLFPGHEVLGEGAFRVIRDSDIEIEEEAEDLVRLYESALKRRRRGIVIRLEIEASMPKSLRAFVAGDVDVVPSGIVLIEGMLALNDLSQLVAIDRPELKFPPYNPRFPERVKELGGDIFGRLGRRTSLSIILTNRSMSSFGSSIKRRTIPAWSRSSRRFTGLRRTARLSGRSSKRRRLGNRSLRWSS